MSQLFNFVSEIIESMFAAGKLRNIEGCRSRPSHFLQPGIRPPGNIAFFVSINYALSICAYKSMYLSVLNPSRNENSGVGGFEVMARTHPHSKIRGDAACNTACMSRYNIPKSRFHAFQRLSS